MKYPPVSVIEAIECQDGSGLALEAAKTAQLMMTAGWKKVRGAGLTKPEATGPPPWFDETDEKRKRMKAKGDGTLKPWIDKPATDPPESKDDLIDAEWEASDDALDHHQVSGPIPSEDPQEDCPKV